jgi:serine/threonine protein kinase
MPRQTIGGRYELEQPLGSGAMSSVWLAHDRELERKVAAKLLAPEADRARFEREAQAVAGLAHPNISQLYDYGEADEGPYMILEYMSGGTLEERLAGERPLDDGETVRIAQEIAAGLAHAHERGLVHRDLKPANILFDAEDRAKIADFGIARIEGGNALTVAGTVLGTAAYLSPEQASGEPATPASDVYSFGVILFRMLTGRPPFAADNAIELVRMHQSAPAPLVEDVRADAPAALAALAQAALAKDPAARPRDGAALLAALTGSGDRVAAASAAATQIIPSPFADDGRTQVIAPSRRSAPRRGRRAPVAVAAALAIAAVGAAAAVVLTSSGGDTGTPPATTTPSLNLPTVGRQTTAASTTSATTTTAPSTSSTSSTSSTTSTQQATTAPATTQSVTTAPAPVPVPVPTTTFTPPPPTTTAPPATTTAPPPTTSTAATTTLAATTTAP